MITGNKYNLTLFIIWFWGKVSFWILKKLCEFWFVNTKNQYEKYWNQYLKNQYTIQIKSDTCFSDVYKSIDTSCSFQKIQLATILESYYYHVKN